jgi:hypothetical protein
MAAPTILNVSPANSAQGIALGDRVVVTFDQAMDETTINTGTFILTGPDQDFVFGPDFTPLDQPGIEDEGILESPYYPGFVQGVITFQRVNASFSPVDVTDYTGQGSLYYTQAIFTPSQPLAPGVKYTVIVSGDENTSDDYDAGVSACTVFDTKLVSVAGSGRLEFGGGFSGSTDKTYTVEITAGGATGNAEYIWWEEADPLTTFPGITTTGRRELENDVWIECDPDGNFTIGDTFKAVCKPPVTMAVNYRWEFHTGSGAIVTPSSDQSTTGIADAVAEHLEIVSMDPDLRSTNVDPATISVITITFNKVLDATTITDDAVRVRSEPVNGDPGFTAEGEIAKILDVSGNTLTIQIN